MGPSRRGAPVGDLGILRQVESTWAWAETSALPTDELSVGSTVTGTLSLGLGGGCDVGAGTFRTSTTFEQTSTSSVR